MSTPLCCSKETIYFAHPIKSYNTQDEQVVLSHLRMMYPGATIINPATMNVSGFTNCKDCMKKAMIPIFFKHVKACTIFAIWNTRDSCGIRCELNKAWELGKKVIQIKIVVQLTEIGLQEYHYSGI